MSISDKLSKWAEETFTAFELLPDIISLHDSQGAYLRVTKTVTQLGYQPSALVGKSAYELFHPGDVMSIAEHHRNTLTGHNPVAIRYRLRMSTGQYSWVETTSQQLRFDGDIVILATTRIITNQVLAEEALRREAKFDQMTGLYKKHEFDNIFSMRVKDARRGRGLALIIIDVDDFSGYNNRHGHPEGDKALVEVARSILVEIRENDTAARYGGEEFAILCVDTRGIDAALIAERIRKRVEALELKEKVTLSAGIAAFSSALSTQEAMTIAADQSLYRAKDLGKNRVYVYRGRPFSQSSGLGRILPNEPKGGG